MKTPEERAKERKKNKIKSTVILFILLFFVSSEGLRAYINLNAPRTFNEFLSLFSSYFSSILSPFFIPNDIRYLLFLLLALMALGMKILIISVDTTITLPDHEQKGSNKWGDINDMKKYRDSDPTKNIIFTQNLQISMDNEKTGINNNTLVVGAAGSGKTFKYISPNLLNVGEECIVVNDVKGEILITHGKHLMDKGYDVRVFNTKNMTNSLHFNPLAYIRKESDILSIAKMLSEALGDGGKSSEDSFWKSAKENLITACIAFIWERREIYPEQCNLPFVNDLLRMAEEKTDAKGRVLKSDFDKIFEINCKQKPNSLSSRCYGNFKMNKDKTRANVLTTLSSMLSCLDIEEARQILSDKDELHLEDLATKKKVAIFLCSSDTDST
ncbi:type IV secretory system conjugative DNA transfer family protein, partial [Intestinibacter sp.]|uniref:type IV secretory system conjugative DNA transfer family protein n=1 Tax=Intestinibacter sp. TaxID=1965304 RepID=UPI003F17D69D